MTPGPFDRPLLELGSRIDEVRASVMYHDPLGSHPQAAELARTSRAWAYVAMAAALEAFVGAVVDELATHINAAAITHKDLDLGVVSVIQAGGFDAAAGGRKQAMWDRRAGILRSADSASVAVVPVGLRPLDGRTIKQAHLESLWAIYDLPGDPLPSPLHGLALRDLSEGRNAVAHGNVDPLAFGSTKSFADVMRRLEQVEDIAIHLAEAGATYVIGAGYRR